MLELLTRIDCLITVHSSDMMT